MTQSQHPHDQQAKSSSVVSTLDPPDITESEDSGTQMVDVVPAVFEPRQVGPYQLQKEIGRGAMGAVYQAVHTSLKRDVAVKILPSDFAADPKRVARFLREMEAVGRLDHGNIVRATDAGEASGEYFLAMDFVDGMDLDRLLVRVGHTSVGAACEIVRQAALGLQHIHENHLVHRDIKPSNLLVTNDGNVKILDLGIAMLRQQGGSNSFTQAGDLMGTPDFMAPEQIELARDVDIRADIYSLGCTLYMMLAGRPPFDEQDTGVAKLLAHARKAPPHLLTIAPEIPKSLAKVVMKMISKSPADRFATPADVAEAMTEWADVAELQQTVQSGSAATRSSNAQQQAVARPTPLSSSFANGNWLIWIAAGIGGAALLGFAAVALLPGGANKDASASRNDGSAKVEVKIQTADSRKTEQSVSQIAADTRSFSRAADKLVNSSESIDKNTAKIAEQTEAIANTLESLKAGYQAAANQGGIIPGAKTPGEFYHNARLYEQQGKYAEARESYTNFFASRPQLVDPHHRFQDFLKLQEGIEGAKAVYHQMFAEADDPVSKYAKALLEEPSIREPQLSALAAAEFDFAPAIYELSRCYSRELLGQQALADKATERRFLERFVAQYEEGQVVRFFLDQSEVASRLRDAQSRLAALKNFDPAHFENPVHLDCQKHRFGWSITFLVSEPTKEIFYRYVDQPDFASTGFLDYTNPSTGGSVPATTLDVRRDLPSCNFDVKYTDVRGITRGPFSLRFEPDQAAYAAAKRALDATRFSWIKFDDRPEFNHLHFAHLFFHRDAIQKVYYAVDKETPLTVYQMPESLDNPTELLVDVSSEATFAVVQLHFKDGTKSDVVRIDR